jgi:steroid delta-isomerase-like uncharacterized protein
MTAQEIRLLADRHVAAFCRHDPALVASNHAENGVVDSPSAGVHSGRAQIAAAYERWFAAFPDIELRLETVVADVNQAALFIRVIGTHRGDFMGLRATGKKIEFPCVLLWQIEGESIAHERRIYDFSALLIQLGLLRVKPS